MHTHDTDGEGGKHDRRRVAMGRSSMPGALRGGAAATGSCLICTNRCQQLGPAPPPGIDEQPMTTHIRWRFRLVCIATVVVPTRESILTPPLTRFCLLFFGTRQNGSSCSIRTSFGRYAQLHFGSESASVSLVLPPIAWVLSAPPYGYDRRETGVPTVGREDRSKSPTCLGAYVCEPRDACRITEAH